MIIEEVTQLTALAADSHVISGCTKRRFLVLDSEMRWPGDQNPAGANHPPMTRPSLLSALLLLGFSAGCADSEASASGGTDTDAEPAATTAADELKGCVDGGAPLQGDSTVIVWDGSLCITDGIGVNLLKDLESQTTVGWLTKIGSTYYFESRDTEHGDELWKTDGTKEGTIMVKDIAAGESPSNIHSLTNVNGTLFFVASEAENTQELWKSDGTAEGTVMVKQINPSGVFGSRPSDLTEMGGKLYFRAEHPVTAAELWVSDGTEGGTQVVKNIQPESDGDFERSSSYPTHLISTGDTLFFRVGTSEPSGFEGFDLWKTDGTEANTVPVKRIEQDADAFSDENIIIEDILYFLVQQDDESIRELWISDGTETGTEKLKDINCNPLILRFEFTEVKDLLYFKIADNADGSSELWKSDGTSEGTVLMRDDPNWTGLFAQPISLTSVNETLFFVGQGDRGESGFEGTQILWKSDGTEAGTQPLSPGFDRPVVVSGQVDNTLIFEADAEEFDFKDILWKTDGTEDGTVRVAVR